MFKFSKEKKSPDDTALKLLEKLDRHAIRMLAPHGKRFGYVLIVTEKMGEGWSEDSAFHLMSNGYAPTRDDPAIPGIILGLLENVSRFLRTGRA